MKNAIKISALATLVAAFTLFTFNHSFAQSEDKPVKCEDCLYGYKKLGEKLFFKQTTKLEYFGKKKFPSHKGPFSGKQGKNKTLTAGDVFNFSGYALVWNFSPEGVGFLVKIPASTPVFKDENGNVFAEICENRFIFETGKKEVEKTEEKKDTVVVVVVVKKEEEQPKPECVPCDWYYAWNGDIIIKHRNHKRGHACCGYRFIGQQIPGWVSVSLHVRFYSVCYTRPVCYPRPQNWSGAWVYAPGFDNIGNEARPSCANYRPVNPKYANPNHVSKCGTCHKKVCSCGKSGGNWKQKNSGGNGTYTGPRRGGTQIGTGKSVKTKTYRKETTTIKRGRN